MAAVTLSTDALRLLRAIKREKKKVAFCKKNRLHYATFSKLLASMPVREDVVAEIENVLLGRLIKGCTSEAIDIVVATGYGITEQMLRQGEVKTRRQDIGEARQMAVFFRSQYMGLSKTAIAREMGYKDHTSVIVNLDTFTNRLKVEPVLQQRLERITGKLRAAC